MPGTQTYRNVARYAGLITDPRVAIVRVDGPLYFANAQFLEDIDTDEAYDLLVQRVAETRDELPEGVTEVDVRTIRPLDVIVFQLAVWSDTAPARTWMSTAWPTAGAPMRSHRRHWPDRGTACPTFCGRIFISTRGSFPIPPPGMPSWEQLAKTVSVPWPRGFWKCPMSVSWMRW